MIVAATETIDFREAFELGAKSQVVEMETKPINPLVKRDAYQRLASVAVNEAIAEKKRKGLPVVRYDKDRGCPYLEYSNGKREYKWN